MSTHVAIIGAYGSAGSAVADRLAEEPDVELTLIDDGDPGGGLCILRGCMPSKEVISAAEHRFVARHDDRLEGPLPDVDFEAVVEQKDDHTLGWAGHRRDSVEAIGQQEDHEFIHDTATFVDDRRIEVDGRVLEPDYVVVATGSTISLPPVPGIEDVPVQTSRDVLDATEFPDSGIVMGLGYIGLELAPYLSEAAGVDLTAIEMLPDLLPEADPGFGDDVADYYREAFDMEVLLDTTAQSVTETEDGGVRMTVEGPNGEQTVEADELYVFTGRVPAVDKLDIDNAGIAPEDGWVRDTMQARDNDRVFVVGDANGKEPVLHVAKEQAATAAENVLAHRAGDSLVTYESTHHHVIFSGLGVLPFARVGHSAASAQEAGLDFVTADRAAADDGVFKAKNAAEGRARLVVGTDGTVLGYQGLHYHADVMAKTMQLAVEMELDVREIPDRSYHPTTPEILDGLISEAADTLDE